MIGPGTAFKFGDDINTDVIIPARYLVSYDAVTLAAHVMEDIAPDFRRKVQRGDMIVAGRNFGTGSSREHAAIAIKAAGVACVIANSFARIFYRNGINVGLPLFECLEAAVGIDGGDQIDVDITTGVITNITKREIYSAQRLPPFMQELLSAGGLVAYTAARNASGELREMQP